VRIVIAAVGARLPDWIDAGYAEYATRMPRELRVELVEIRPERRGASTSAAQVLSREAARIEAALPARCLRVVLDERGRPLDTVALSRRLADWMGSGRDVGCVIGGADGIAPELKESADLLLALSAMTLPHGLARVVLAEQLYRAHTLLCGHPYHRA
jgi:23S rRNA (pseudouridine1915-N3)-methyltransferase